MISIYTSAFNVSFMEFSWEESLNRFLSFADEVCVAVNTSKDNTQDLLVDWTEEVSRTKPEKGLQLIFTDFGYNLPDLDGLIKNAALQETTHPYKLGLDLDEYILSSFRPKLEELSKQFLYDKTDCIMLPVLNLYGNEKIAKDISQKFYFHRAGLHRGTVNFAKNPDGTHNTEQSDSCELLEKNGELPRCMYFFNPNLSAYEKLLLINKHDLPYIVHTGYLDLDKRIKKNREFWKKHWEIEAGHPVDNVPTTIEELGTPQTFEHGLKLQDEPEPQKLIEGGKSEPNSN